MCSKHRPGASPALVMTASFMTISMVCTRVNVFARCATRSRSNLVSMMYVFECFDLSLGRMLTLPPSDCGNKTPSITSHLKYHSHWGISLSYWFVIVSRRDQRCPPNTVSLFHTHLPWRLWKRGWAKFLECHHRACASVVLTSLIIRLETFSSEFVILIRRSVALISCS